MAEQYVYRFSTDTGTEVRVRPETPDDVPYMIDLYEHLDPESRLQRFNDRLENPDPGFLRQEAARLTQLDPAESQAWLAFADLPGAQSTPVAGGRYTRKGPGEVDAMVVVRDDMQRKGIGSRLLYFLLDQARAAGFQKATSRFSATNEAVWQILQYSPYHVTWHSTGQEVEAIFHLQARTASISAMN